jgi:hypothetical protein
LADCSDTVGARPVVATAFENPATGQCIPILK